MAIARRAFLAGLGGAAAGLGLGRLSHLFPLPSPLTTPAWSPGAEKAVASTCMLCPARCGIVGRVVDGSLVRIDGNPLHPVSRGGLCPKGRAGIQLLYHPARLTGPVERVGPPGSDEFRLVSWDDALARVSSALSSLRDEGRAGTVGVLAGHTTGLMGELLDRFERVYGCARLEREDYDDGGGQVMAHTLGRAVAPSFDFERSDLVLSFGAALSESWWSPPQSARARDVDRGPRWLQVDTRLSRTAVASDEFFPLRPGSFGALALAIAYVMLKEGLYDDVFVGHHVSHFEDWKDGAGETRPGYRSLILRHGSPEGISGVTGLPVERIVQLAKTFGRAERPVAVWDQAASWREGGMADALAIHALNVLRGRIGRAGGVFAEPRLPVPGLTDAPPEEAGPRAPWPAPDGDTDKLELLFLYASNPVASRPKPERVMKTLAGVPLVVSFSPFLDETARHAHLVLPEHTYLERWQDAPAPRTVPYPVWGVVQPIVPPLHDTRSTGDVLLDLASRVGGDVAAALSGASMEELVRERGEHLASVRRGGTFVREFRRDELSELEARGWWLPHGQSPGAFWASTSETGGWFDPHIEEAGPLNLSQRRDGRVALFPPEARGPIEQALPGRVLGVLPRPGSGTAEEEGAQDGDGTLLLNPYRVMTMTSGGTALMPWLLERVGVLNGEGWEAWVEINPRTGEELGVASGQMVRVASDHGSFVARLRYFRGAQPGVVNAPYGLHSAVTGWGALDAANPLAAAGDRRDPASGLPDWYSTRVRVEPV